LGKHQIAHMPIMTTKEIIDIVSIAKKRGWISFPKPEGELTQEQKDRIAEIIASMDCQKDFECYESNFENICKAAWDGLPQYAKCLEERYCEFQQDFGTTTLCRCPLRVHLTKHFKT